MSFSVQVPQHGLEWSGSDLRGLFAQKRNLLSPRFWRMLADIFRFNHLATKAVLAADEVELKLPIGDFLDHHDFGTPFRDWYFLPMIGCIWSCPTDQMLGFPVATLLRFCHNHGLLQWADRPQWHTVRGGSRNYVERLLPRIADRRLATPVRAVRRKRPGQGRDVVTVCTDAGGEQFDDVVLACHSDQALALLDEARVDERALLGAIRYQPNQAVLHTDPQVLPRRSRAWAAWNYERSAGRDRLQAAVCLHYLINRLQPLPWRTPVIVSLNPERQPRPECVLGEYHYEHPVFDSAAIEAQTRLATIQGRAGLWFCGAWTGHGFHEDGLVSALAVAQALRDSWAASVGRLENVAA